MADFVSSDGKRFDGDFIFVAVGNYASTEAERAYIECLAGIVARLGTEKPGPPEFADEFAMLRSRQCAALREKADELASRAAGAERDTAARALIQDALRLEGGYLERRGRMMRVPFKIETVGTPVTDIVVVTRDVAITEEKQRFKVEIDKAATVVKTVLGRRGDTAPSRFGSGRRDLNEWKLDDYMKGIAGIARVGLMNEDRTQTPFAALALQGFKDEFVAREAGLIKNAYVFRLGIAAALAVALCLAALFAIDWWRIPLPQANFLWLWIGAAAGTWLSFSLRRVILTFSDLVVLEEDRLRPEFRIMFVLVLTTVVGLFFWTGMVTITIGTFTTNFAGLGNRDVAVLIGALCGIAERSMSSAVTRRADDFAISVGGGDKKTVA